MKTEVVVALIVFAGGGLTILGNYLISKRTTSGSISTSDAASLWAESNALREEYKAQAKDNADRADKLEKRLEEVNTQLQEVMAQLTALKGDSATMIKKIDELKRIIAKLRKENSRLIAERKRAGTGA